MTDFEYTSMSDESDEEYYLMMAVRVQKIKRFRRRIDFDKWDESEFYTRFRMSKHSAFTILQQIRFDIENITTWNKALTPETMLLLTLRFYASGGFLITSGDLSGVFTATASRVIKKVSHHIAMLRKYYIKFPDTEDGKKQIVLDFYNIAKFPGVIAAMDCSHVHIQSPGLENGESFRNRKGYFSINVQTLCDSKLKILDIVARWPGASHDSTIFNNSRICSRFERGEFGSFRIVADGGYQCRNYVLTPLRNCNSPEEVLYNELQIRTRNCIERSYGVWKRRFPVLATELRLKLLTIQSVIVATAILHNICIINNEGEPPSLDDHLLDQINLTNNVGTQPVQMEANTTVR